MAKLNEAQFKQLVRNMARKALKEHAEKKAATTKTAQKRKITKEQLREMVQDTILECLEEELDRKLQEKKGGGKWMQKAVHPSKKGEFTAKAKKAGMGVQAYAKHVLANTDDFSEETVNQAKFAKSAKSVAKGK